MTLEWDDRRWYGRRQRSDQDFDAQVSNPGIRRRHLRSDTWPLRVDAVPVWSAVVSRAIHRTTMSNGGPRRNMEPKESILSPKIGRSGRRSSRKYFGGNDGEIPPFHARLRSFMQTTERVMNCWHVAISGSRLRVIRGFGNPRTLIWLSGTGWNVDIREIIGEESPGPYPHNGDEVEKQRGPKGMNVSKFRIYAPFQPQKIGDRRRRC